MILNSVLFLSALLFSIGILFLQKTFFSFCLAAVKQLDVLLSNQHGEDERQQALIKNLLNLLKHFGVFFLQLSIVVIVSLLPLIAYFLTGIDIGALEPKTLLNAIFIIIGGLLPFFFVPKKKEDYPAWHKLIHRLILPNYNLHKQLFRLEVKRIKSDQPRQEEFLVVSGLARAGTTALCESLYSTGQFHSLIYANMPFLLAPNLWKKIYNPKPKLLKERAHGDGIRIGVNSPEALDEYFFNAQTNEHSWQSDNLNAHIISKDVYEDYIKYQAIIASKKKETTYLSKNNNFLLRYDSMRTYNKQFKILFMFREPKSHAISLFRQHKRFCDKQNTEPFVLEYMNLLGHHEFGNGHKRFNFNSQQLSSKYDTQDINYWLEVWINYYEFLMSLPADENLHIIDYRDLLDSPQGVIDKLETVINKGSFDKADIKSFTPKKYEFDFKFNEDLLLNANAIYNQMCNMKLVV